MPEYLIDYNRGSDSNDGITAPWKNISKLAALTNLASGSRILLADDSEWTLTAHTTVGSGWLGTRDQPITIGKYSPLSASQSRPRITRYRSIAANEWAWNGTHWWMQWHASLGVHWGSYIKLGGDWGQRQGGSATLNADLQWRDGSGADAGKLFVYAPAGTNPTDYYGSVDFAPGSLGVLHFGSNGGFVVVQDIDLAQSGPLISMVSSSGTRQFVVRRIRAHDVGVAVRFLSSTGGAQSLVVEDSEFSGGGTSYIATDATSGLGFGGLVVQRNRFRGGGIAYSQGQVYVQTRGAGNWIFGNEFDGAGWGAGYTTQDGCAIYAEVGSSDVVVVGNRVKNCHNAMTDNSGRKTTWMGNLVLDCLNAMKCDDFSGVGQTDHRFYNNSVINAGAPVPSLGAVSMGGIGWYSYKNLAVDLRNNLFTKHPDAAANAAIELGASATGTIAYNLQHGFRALAETYQGGVSPITATGTVSEDPLLDSSYRPLPGSPCIGAGVYIPGAKHMGGVPVGNPADIGAYRAAVEREIASSRDVRRY